MGKSKKLAKINQMYKSAKAEVRSCVALTLRTFELNVKCRMVSITIKMCSVNRYQYHYDLRNSLVSGEAFLRARIYHINL